MCRGSGDLSRRILVSISALRACFGTLTECNVLTTSPSLYSGTKSDPACLSGLNELNVALRGVHRYSIYEPCYNARSVDWSLQTWDDHINGDIPCVNNDQVRAARKQQTAHARIINMSPAHIFLRSPSNPLSRSPARAPRARSRDALS